MTTDERDIRQFHGLFAAVAILIYPGALALAYLVLEKVLFGGTI